MKMKFITLSALCILTSLATAQTLLYNNGATIKIQAGATLYVEGGVENTASGTIDNDGLLDIKGDLTNLGNWEASEPNTVKFSGAAHSNVNAGSAQFHNVVVQKDNTFNVNLVTTDMTVTNNLDFNTSTGSTRLVTGDKILKLGAAATVTGADSDEYIATTGTLGMVEKTVTTDGSFTFPIGDLTNYTPLANVYTGSSYTNAKLSARSNDAVHPNRPSKATDYLSRYWDINATGIATYVNTLTGTYASSGDVIGTAGNVKGAVYNGTEWFYVDAGLGTNQVIGKTTHASSDFTGTNFFGKIDIIALLDGPYETGPMLMTTSLNSLGLIPLISPYADAPDTVLSIPANVTDWVKIELRDANNPSLVLGKASAFVKNNGAVVGPDGTSLPLIKNGNASSIIAVFHRNHLPFRTDVGIDVVNPTLINFGTDTSIVYNNLTDNLPLNFRVNKFLMWPCDAIGTSNVVNSADFGNVKLLSTSLPEGYLRADINLNSIVNSADFGRTKLVSTPFKIADF